MHEPWFWKNNTTNSSYVNGTSFLQVLMRDRTSKYKLPIVSAPVVLGVGSWVRFWTLTCESSSHPRQITPREDNCDNGVPSITEPLCICTSHLDQLFWWLQLLRPTWNWTPEPRQMCLVWCQNQKAWTDEEGSQIIPRSKSCFYINTNHHVCTYVGIECCILWRHWFLLTL